MLSSAGCHQYPDMFIDDMPDSSMFTTTSAQYARRVPTTPEPRQRDFDPVRAEAEDGDVAHGPLWMEDSFEMAGSDDEQYAVTLEDAAYFFPLGPGRFVADILLLPVSILMDPSWTIMCSDGVERRSRESGSPQPYDAERCSGATIPADIHEAWTFDEPADVEPAPEGELR